MGAPGPSGIGPLVLAVVRPDGDVGRRQDPSKRRPSKGGQHEGNGVQTRTRGEGSIRVAQYYMCHGPCSLLCAVGQFPFGRSRAWCVTDASRKCRRGRSREGGTESRSRPGELELFGALSGTAEHCCILSLNVCISRELCCAIVVTLVNDRKSHARGFRGF